MNRFIFAVLAGMVLLTPRAAQAVDPAGVIAALGSSSWQERDKAVAEIKGPIAADAGVRAAAIALLEKENAIREQWNQDERDGKSPAPLKTRFGEGYGEYYVNLVAKVISFKDTKSVDSLVGALDVGAPEKALSEMGDVAAPAAIADFSKSRNKSRRAAIVRLLGRLADKGLADPTLRAQAKKAVFDGADDPAPNVREAAVKNLHRFGKQEALEKLKKIADTDSESFVHKGQNKRKYPVRESAQKELDRLTKSK